MEVSDKTSRAYYLAYLSRGDGGLRSGCGLRSAHLPLPFHGPYALTLVLEAELLVAALLALLLGGRLGRLDYYYFAPASANYKILL